jgi:hypothetical protein
VLLPGLYRLLCRARRFWLWTLGLLPLGSRVIDAAVFAGAFPPWTSLEKANPSPAAKMFGF